MFTLLEIDFNSATKGTLKIAFNIWWPTLVCFKRIFPRKCFFTVGTREWMLSSVGTMMYLKTNFLGKRLWAKVALKRLFSSVYTMMCLKTNFLAKRLRANVALKRLFSGMCPFMIPKIRIDVRGVWAKRTGIFSIKPSIWIHGWRCKS